MHKQHFQPGMMMPASSAFHHKDGGADPVKEVADKLAAKFTEFKDTNEKRLNAVESEKAALAGKLDTLTEQITALEGLKATIEAMEKKANRPGTTTGTPEAAEHKEAFNKFLRKGQDQGLGALQAKALNITDDPDGGYAVPEELDRNIISLLRNATPMRQLANVIAMGGAEYKKLVSVGGAASGWVGEQVARPATGTPTLAQVTPFMGELYANPQSTQTMLDDAFFNAEAWLSDEVATEFAEKENLAFTSGDGTLKPKGLLAYATAATIDGTRPFGTFQHIESAGIGAISGDDIVKFATYLKTGYLMGSRWQFSRTTLAALMILKDGDGNYLWRPGLSEGVSSVLAGFGYTINDDMPAIAAGANSIAFGDHKRAYTIIDRMGTRVLRDPFTNKPFVGFYTTKRVGGMAVDTQAVKFLKIRTS
ncbi:phage major capsid protein [Arsukibacterium sp. UBA3155]|uniref:phage major capsid protein n=1 Tax=Arsukibacterium sp. UBA3155 TaxID=1946058 RepID=UPI0025BB3582|nr:phage major capsid protein [Arsukibacterium sp. UBA3155]|tara:strand:- start:35486 stop:36751 length:1266 start_codon:yes stop_codon:yes gene_type:complete